MGSAGTGVEEKEFLSACVRGRCLGVESDAARVVDQEYHKLYLELLERNRMLERGPLGAKTERPPRDEQLTLGVLGMMLPGGAPADARFRNAGGQAVHAPQADRSQAGARALALLRRGDLARRGRARGRRSVREDRRGDHRGAERRPSSAIVVRFIKPKFVREDRDRGGEATVLVAVTPTQPIAQCLAGPVCSPTACAQADAMGLSIAQTWTSSCFGASQTSMATATAAARPRSKSVRRRAPHATSRVVQKSAIPRERQQSKSTCDATDLIVPSLLHAAEPTAHNPHILALHRAPPGVLGERHGVSSNCEPTLLQVISENSLGVVADSTCASPPK